MICQCYFTENGCIQHLRDKKLPILMFADDTVLLSTSSHGLQHSLRLLESFCNKWQLTVSLKKTKVMVFNANFKPLKYSFFIYNERVDIVASYTYLGISLTPSGNVKNTRVALKNKALRALFAYTNVLNTHNGASVDVQLHLFDSLVKPILLYGSEVWGAYIFRRVDVGKFNEYFLKPVMNDIESTHIKACRYMLGVNKTSCIHACLGELGRFPLLITVIENVKYSFRLKQIKGSLYVLIPKNLLVNQCTSYQKSSIIHSS